MREMKDSGVAWIGQIPKDWITCKAKFLMKTPVETGTGSEAILYDPNEIRYIRISDFDKAGKIDDSKKVSLPKNIGMKYLLKDGDILIATAGGTVGKSMIFTDIGEPCAYAGYLARYDVNELILNRYFFLYFLQSPLFSNFRNGALLKATIENISATKYANMHMIVPPLLEQERIVLVLNKKICKIDALITNQEQQIEKLKQLKQSIITEVVTKGLDPNVPMKDSGVEWIGEIPEHWSICRIKDKYSLRNERNFESDLNKVNLISLYTDLGVVPHSDIVETTGNRAVTAEGYKIVHNGDIVVNIILCWMGAVGMSNYYGVTSPAYDIYKPLKDTNSRYYHYLFRTKSFNGECYRYGRGIMLMRWRTYSNEFTAINVPVPPLEEQQEIAEYLDTKCSMVDQLIDLKQKKIGKLQEYKKSLIYEYVTGKKEV